MLGRFFCFLQQTGITARNPVTPAVVTSISARGDPFMPYIYSQQEIEALLDAARNLERDIYYPLKPETYELLIRLLYTLGLRVGEALRLRLADIDTARASLFICNTKFYKDRIVPYGPRLAQHIRTYLDAREACMPSGKPGAPFFFGRRGIPIPVGEIDKRLPLLLESAGIHTGPEKRRPRWHDMRHSFAVSRLLQWYEEGADVQSKLILLTTFMGHADIASTQVYLTITEQLLRVANDRFYQKFGQYC
jgi:site-specific recombinase XerD